MRWDEMRWDVTMFALYFVYIYAVLAIKNEEESQG